ncbi:hypothetical protein GQ44DRAFT_627442 [Phaeosphaeriaceae sp. PMI808]|nr:hypothetical protein GQ44DRAFT_627442 [Phaeosphaeriaceae sp. PMI808]
MSSSTPKLPVNISQTLAFHERYIPTLALGMNNVQARVHTDFSFCLATSLAFFKRSTWEQTPWTPHMLDHRITNPITAMDAQTIAGHLNVYSDTGITTEIIQNSLLFASAYPSYDPDISEGLGTYPHLFVLFPRARGPIATNAAFLKTWHDEIVKPAFDRAWRDSGLAHTYGAEVDGMTRILPAAGSYTVQDALPSKGFLKRLQRGASGSVRAYWPAWTMDPWGKGTEGESSLVRARIMHEAWNAITGMVKGHPDLKEFQDPLLLAVCRGRYDLSSNMSAQAVYKNVGQEWDHFVDAQFVVSRSFKVVLETVVEIKGKGDQDMDEAEIASLGNVVGRAFKRMAVQEEIEEYEADGSLAEDRAGHQDKRRRKI